MCESVTHRGLGLRLDGRVIIVTGASSGLGEQFATALAAAGARVVLAARREERIAQLAEHIDGEALAVRTDVCDAADRKRLIATAVDRFGRIDGLVNNAGIGDVRPALRQSHEDFAGLLDVNLVAPFALARAAAATMRETGGGSIVNVASIAGLVAIAWMPQASYAASKAGLVGLTRELASQWGRYDVRVNAIAPGPFVSELTGGHFIDGPAAERMNAAVPLGRVGRPGELDGLLLLLLHPSGAYISGQTIAVDGGLSATR